MIVNRFLQPSINKLQKNKCNNNKYKNTPSPMPIKIILAEQKVNNNTTNHNKIMNIMAKNY